MALPNSLFPLLSRLWAHIGRGQRRQLFLLILLMMVVALAEMVSIGTIFPFLAVLTGPERVFNHPLGQHVASLFGFSEPRQLLLPITLLFAVAIVLAGCMRLLLVWVQTNISYAIGSDLALDVYRRTLYQPYAVHTSRNSSEIINGVYSKASGISSYVILPLVTIVSTATLVIAILVTLIGVDPFTSLLALAGFGVIYGGVIKLTHRRLFRNSRLVADEAGRVIKSLQEGLGGIRDVLIDRTQDVYCGAFRKTDLSMRAAQINSAFIAQSPRFAMEALGMLLIATLAYNLAQGDGGIVSAMPVLGALALGAQRLLPLLQQCFQAWSSIRSNQASLVDTLDLLEQPMPEYAQQSDVSPLVFERNIRLEDVYFRYSSESDWVLRGVCLEISKGSRVGVMGETGCGKSTMLDIVMGLLSPTSGSLVVDGMVVGTENGNAWQAHIAHVPQSVFLADSSIASNIAFGVPVDDIDMERVREAALRARLLDTIESWPEQFDTRVGERGVRLSGGQRQRIGIARALYKRADVLVFDEATSALDNETERAVMESIQALGADTTVLIIAHRLNTLSSCNIIVELGKGQVIRVGSYRDILSNS